MPMVKGICIGINGYAFAYQTLHSQRTDLKKRHLNITMCSYTLALVYILYFLRDDGNPLFEINSICAYLVVLPQ